MLSNSNAAWLRSLESVVTFQEKRRELIDGFNKDDRIASCRKLFPSHEPGSMLLDSAVRVEAFRPAFSLGHLRVECSVTCIINHIRIA